MTCTSLLVVLTTVGSITTAAAFDVQGHRGARGERPENTLPAFELAIEQGATTLETDLGLTRDGVLVLSHDRTLNPVLTRHADGTWLTEPGPTIRSLDHNALRTFDVGRLRPGSTYAAQWPAQRPIDGTRIPRLTDLFELAVRRAPAIRFNLETKLLPWGTDTADPDTFARVVVDAVRAAGVADRVTVQSFDWRTLLIVRQIAPDIRTSCLTIETGPSNTVADRSHGEFKVTRWLGGLNPADHQWSAPRLAHAAGCAVWSPFWSDVTADNIATAHALGLRVVPWTVNDPIEMARQIGLGVDGLISDYPARLRAAVVAAGRVPAVR